MCWGQIGDDGICCGETRWWQWNPPACEFPWLLPPLYKQVEVREDWQDKQAEAEHSCCVEWKWLALAARSWSWFPCWGSWRCSCAAPLKVSELGQSVPGSSSQCCSAVCQPCRGVHAHSWQQDEGEMEGNLFSKVCCLNPLLSMGSWIVRGLNSKYPRQHGLNRFYLLCRFPSFQHKATRIAACLTPKFACLVGPWRVILNNSPVKSVISMQSCKLLFKRSCFFLTCINFRMCGQKQWFEHYKHDFSCFFKMLI